MIEIPDRMKKFPLWKGKYPIHFTVMTNPKKEPDFKVMYEPHRIEAFNKNLCHLCGERMTAPYALIGGIKCVFYRGFIDGPMHLECARYAAAACPFLNSSRAAYSKKTGLPASRPPQMFLVIAKSYQVVKNPGNRREAEGVQALNPLSAGQWTAVAGEYLEIHEIETDQETNRGQEETLVCTKRPVREGKVAQATDHQEGEGRGD